MNGTSPRIQTLVGGKRSNGLPVENDVKVTDGVIQWVRLLCGTPALHIKVLAQVPVPLL